ncbi:hypothetical protein PYW07_012513 [Mythimna separata]|uniref:KAT8 regulatory NSL complex subunit 3 n=1 Tax=Mythimna separata TaxID=271217 RepID=A0AAD7YMD1_MYTSE|nr:hypothetical protein PYW07_012513 [Mythimna separata]
MVMATGSVCQQLTGSEQSHEMDEAEQASAEATALHERLVAYVHALAGAHEQRSGVWVEHSYARARGAPHAPAATVRVLLAPCVPAERADVDVEREDPPPPALPAPAPEPEHDDSDAEPADDWEARVTALAPSAVHLRLAEQALDTLRRMRLERLAGGGAGDDAAARSAARRLRLALAGAAAHAGAHAQRPAAWLHATLHAYMPAHVRRQYGALLGWLARAAPRLAARLAGAAVPAARSPLARVGRSLGAEARPWLVWVGCGRGRLDARWARRLGALLHTRVLGAGGGAAATPEAWCAAVAGSVRAALADTLAEAGSRPVILGGIGAGAALVTALAGGAAGVRGLLLLAPPLLTAEGARDTPDDALADVRLPMLVVAGTGAAASWRGAARELARARPDVRRVLELCGADDALRLPAHLQRRLRLPQHALDAAVAEECARWAIETATHGGDEAPARERRRRDARVERVLRVDDEEEYAHLPAAARGPLAAPDSRPDKLTESVAEPAGRRGAAPLEASSSLALGSGRVVSRGSGATPLALLPPRRRVEPSEAPALAAADIMRLPIVFADDEAALEEPAASPLTVTSGSRYTRVIVASRGGPLGPGRARVRPGGERPGGGVRPTRPVLLRRGLRLLPRADRPH